MKHDKRPSENEPVNYPLVSGQLRPEFIEKAKSELFETAENSKLKIEQMKELIRKDPGMEEEWFKDDVILMYLRSKKFDVGRSFTSLKKMVAFVQKNRQYFQPPDPEVMKKVIEQKIFTVMPRRDKEGCSVGVLKLGNWNTMEISVTDVLRCCIFMALPLVTDPMSQINGCKVIYDFKGRVMPYIRYCTPFYMYLMYQIIFECIPVRVKGIHGINPTMICKMMMSVLQAVLTEKVRKRLHIHDNLESMKEALQENVIPAEYGGRVTEEEVNFDWRKQLHMPEYISAILENQKS